MQLACSACRLLCHMQVPWAEDVMGDRMYVHLQLHRRHSSAQAGSAPTSQLQNLFKVEVLHWVGEARDVGHRRPSKVGSKSLCVQRILPQAPNSYFMPEEVDPSASEHDWECCSPCRGCSMHKAGNLTARGTQAELRMPSLGLAGHEPRCGLDRQTHSDSDACCCSAALPVPELCSIMGTVSDP